MVRRSKAAELMSGMIDQVRAWMFYDPSVAYTRWLADYEAVALRSYKREVWNVGLDGETQYISIKESGMSQWNRFPEATSMCFYGDGELELCGDGKVPNAFLINDLRGKIALDIRFDTLGEFFVFNNVYVKDLSDGWRVVFKVTSFERNPGVEKTKTPGR